MKVDLSGVSETNFSEKYPPLAPIEASRDNNQHCFWTTKKGETMWIRDMNNNHLLHTIAMLEREASETLLDEIDAGHSFLGQLQGEMAQYYVERDLNVLSFTTPEQFLARNRQYWIMICLAHKRRILNWWKYDAVRSMKFG